MSKCFWLWQEFCLAQERRNKLKLSYFVNVNILKLQQRNVYLYNLLKIQNFWAPERPKADYFSSKPWATPLPYLELYYSSEILLLLETHFLWYGISAELVEMKATSIWQNLPCTRKKGQIKIGTFCKCEQFKNVNWQNLLKTWAAIIYNWIMDHAVFLLNCIISEQNKILFIYKLNVNKSKFKC